MRAEQNVSVPLLLPNLERRKIYSSLISLIASTKLEKKNCKLHCVYLCLFLLVLNQTLGGASTSQRPTWLIYWACHGWRSWSPCGMSWVDLSAKSFFMRRLHYFHYALNDSFHTSVWMSVKIVSHPGHGAIWRKLDWSAHTATHMQVQADSDISIKTYVMCVNVDVWRYCVIPCNANSHLCWLLEVVSLNGIHYSIWSPVIWR